MVVVMVVEMRVAVWPVVVVLLLLTRGGAVGGGGPMRVAVLVVLVLMMCVMHHHVPVVVVEVVVVVVVAHHGVLHRKGVHRRCRRPWNACWDRARRHRTSGHGTRKDIRWCRGSGR
jgi:hypothetical protein